jgi:DNA-binding PucR family transcriptional regulator
MVTGIGLPVAALADGMRSYQQATAVARLLLAPPGHRLTAARPARVSLFEEVREEIAVQSLRERVEDRHFAEGDAADLLIRRDEQQGTDLARTALAYLNLRESVRATSERMHVHPNTVRYRIEVMRNELGIDLDQPAVRLWLWLRLSTDAAVGMDNPRRGRAPEA